MSSSCSTSPNPKMMSSSDSTFPCPNSIAQIKPLSSSSVPVKCSKPLANSPNKIQLARDATPLQEEPKTEPDIDEIKTKMMPREEIVEGSKGKEQKTKPKGINRKSAKDFDRQLKKNQRLEFSYPDFYFLPIMSIKCFLIRKFYILNPSTALFRKKCKRGNRAEEEPLPIGFV